MSALCSEHGTPMRTEPLTRPDGAQVGSLTLDVCDRCDAEADENFDAFLSHVAIGDLNV